MTDLNTSAAFLRDLLQKAGVTGYAIELSESENRELNTEQQNFTLYRTMFNHSASVTAYIAGRKGAASGTDLTEEGLKELVEDACAAAQSAEPDDANGYAEHEPQETFTLGPLQPDMERFHDRLRELMDTVARDYPKILLMQIVASHHTGHRLYENAGGVRFEAYEGEYSVMLEYAGHEGDATTGLAAGSITLRDLDTPILDHGLLRKQLRDTEDSLVTCPVGGKFTGTVILTPDALAYFTYMLISNYMSAGVIMDGTSQWLDKMDTPVVSDKITLRLQAEDDRLVLPAPFTSDGYRAENVTLIDRGVLRANILNLYAARKTGRPVTKNTGTAFVMDPGDTPAADMIKSVRRGLIVGGFSGGQPGANGEFSGVAKNSFYVEDGEIRGAVMETMISGNLADLFTQVTAVSRELFSDGTLAFPYMACEGITISGN